MGTLTSTLVISLKDLVSGPARGIAGALTRLEGHARVLHTAGAKIAHTTTALQGLGALSIAMPGALAVSSFGHNQYEWDKALHQFRAISEASEDTMSRLQEKIRTTSNEVGVMPMELLEAARGWQELGNSPETFIKNVGVAARTSRITGIEVQEQMKESSALMRAWGHSMDEADVFKHYEEVYLVASKGMKGGAPAFGEAMKSWAPVAAGLGLTMEEASAFVQTLGGQFEASEIGNALKTSFMRLANPVPKSEAMLRAQGIDPAQVFRYDAQKVGDADALIGALRGTGSFNITPDVERLIRGELENVDLSKGANPLKDKLNASLADALGGKKMSAQDRKILQAAILNHFAAAAIGLDPAAFFKVFGPLSKNVAFMSQVFGKEHAAKMMDLLKQWEHYNENLQNIIDHAPGALERKWSIFGEGFAREWDRVAAAWDNLMKSVGAAGVTSDMIGLFQALQGILVTLQTANPQFVRFGFWLTAAAAALPMLGVYAWAARAGFAALAAMATALISPLLRLFRIGRLLGFGAGAAKAGTLAEIFGLGAAGAVAAGSTAAGRSLLSRAGAILIPGLGWIMLGTSVATGLYSAYEDYQKTGDWWSALKSGIWGFLTMGLGGDAKAAESQPKPAETINRAGNAVATGQPIQLPEVTVNQGAGGSVSDSAQNITSTINAAMDQVRAIISAVDLSAEGRRIADSLANGIRSGIAAIEGAARDAASAAAHAAVRGAYSDGGFH